MTSSLLIGQCRQLLNQGNALLYDGKNISNFYHEQCQENIKIFLIKLNDNKNFF